MEEYVCIKLVRAEYVKAKESGEEIPDNPSMSIFKGESNSFRSFLTGKDGYWIPESPDNETGVWVEKEEFEKTHRPISKLKFSMAMQFLTEGWRIRRICWPEGSWLAIFKSDNLTGEEHIQFIPWIGLKMPDNLVVPWSAAHNDMLSNDWELVTD